MKNWMLTKIFKSLVGLAVENLDFEITLRFMSSVRKTSNMISGCHVIRFEFNTLTTIAAFAMAGTKLKRNINTHRQHS